MSYKGKALKFREPNGVERLLTISVNENIPETIEKIKEKNPSWIYVETIEIPELME